MRKNDKKTPKKQSPSPSFHLEADRDGFGMNIHITGVVCVSEFTDDLVILKTHSASVHILGSKMKMCVYENHAVRIDGYVEDIKFCYGKN